MSRRQYPLLIATLCAIPFVMIQCFPTGDESYKVVTYDELTSLNASCDPYDSCRANRSADTLEAYNCMCSTSCVHLDTCCVDSPFSNTGRMATTKYPPSNRTMRSLNSTFSNIVLKAIADHSPFHDIVRNTTSPPSNTVRNAKAEHSTLSNTVRSAKCLEVYGGKTFYMVDTCSPWWSDDGLVEGMCKGDGEDNSDPFLAIPVTSLKSGITYKNFFCSVCSGEQDEDLSFWNIQLSNGNGLVDREELPEMFYNDSIGSWMMTSGNDSLEEPVTFSIKIPPGVTQLVHKCNPDLVSTCPANWTDEESARKCSDYMAKIVFIREDGGMVWYRNPHCAICNHENLLEKFCYDMSTSTRLRPSGVQDVLFVGLFVLEDRNKKCSKDMVYDAFFKKCRIARCAKGKVFRDGKCVLSDA